MKNLLFRLSIFLDTVTGRLNPGNPGNGQSPSTQPGDSLAYRTGLTSQKIMDNFISVVGFLGTYVGAGILIVGIFQFLFALKDHDGDGKSKAINFIIAGAAFFALGMILNAIFSE